MMTEGKGKLTQGPISSVKGLVEGYCSSRYGHSQEKVVQLQVFTPLSIAASFLGLQVLLLLGVFPWTDCYVSALVIKLWSMSYLAGILIGPLLRMKVLIHMFSQALFLLHCLTTLSTGTPSGFSDRSLDSQNALLFTTLYTLNQSLQSFCHKHSFHLPQSGVVPRAGSESLSLTL